MTGTRLHYIVLANPSSGSFCHAAARSYAGEVSRRGQRSQMVDLNAMAFDPVLKSRERADREDDHHPWIDAEVARIRASDALVLVYPIWFGGPPAILKGYVDRVVGAGCGFRPFSAGTGVPFLRGRVLFSITTSGTPLEWLEDRGQRRALREGFDVYLERGFGLRDAGHLELDQIVPNMSTAHAEAALRRVAEAATRVVDLLQCDL